MFLSTATGIPNGDAAQAALQQAYPTIPYPGIGKFNYFNQRHLALFIDIYIAPGLGFRVCIIDEKTSLKMRLDMK